MKIIDLEKLDKFIKKNNQARKPIKEWIKIVSKVKWKKFSDIKQTFNSADKVGDKIVFNIAGNNYRIDTYVTYEGEIVIIDCIMTHEAYSRKKYKK